MDAHVSPTGALILAGVLLVAAVSAVLPSIVRLRATGAGKDPGDYLLGRGGHGVLLHLLAVQVTPSCNATAYIIVLFGL